MQTRHYTSILFLFAGLIGCTSCSDQPTGNDGLEPGPQLLSTPASDAKYVYFRDDGVSGGGTPGIYRISRDGDEVEFIAANGIFPSVNEHNKLAFIYDAQALFVKDLAADSVHLVTTGEVVGVSWHNDDTLLYAIFGEGIFLRYLYDAESVPVTSGGLMPSSSVNGEFLFMRYVWRAGIDTSYVIRARIDGTETLLYESEDYLRDPSLSPDGTKVVFWKSYNDLYVLDITTGELSGILASWARDPCWSPEGRIVYVQLNEKDGTKNGLLWEMNADGSGKRQLTSWDDIR